MIKGVCSGSVDYLLRSYRPTPPSPIPVTQADESFAVMECALTQSSVTPTTNLVTSPITTTQTLMGPSIAAISNIPNTHLRNSFTPSNFASTSTPEFLNPVAPIPVTQTSTLTLLSENQSMSSTTALNHPSRQYSFSSFLPNNMKLMVKNPFAAHQVLLGMSIAVLLAILGAADGNSYIPAKIFCLNPRLYNTFIILDAIAFTASVIGICLSLHEMHRRISEYLSVISFLALVCVFVIYIWVLLPRELKFIPYVFFSLILFVSVYVYVRSKTNFDQDERHADLPNPVNPVLPY